MWGQADFAKFLIDRFRIIPTRVGTRRLSLPFKVLSGDHPHACGDKFIISLKKSYMLGSSPRVWGQETITQSSQKGCRIIPTRVGTSSGVDTSIPFPKDHPHACGDKPQRLQRRLRPPGSSPRVWGQENAGNNAEI